MTFDPYALALERADEDEQAHALAEHYFDRGLVPPLIFGRPVVASSSAPRAAGRPKHPLEVREPGGVIAGLA